MYELKASREVEQDLKELPAYYRRKIADAVETQLRYEPITATRNRKQLAGLIPPWEAEPPVWELRVEDYRVFYDVDEANRIVYIRAVRRKPAGMTTEEIL